MTEQWVGDPPVSEASQIERHLRIVPEQSLIIPTVVVKDMAWIDGMKIPFTVEMPLEITDEVPLVLMNGYFGIEASSAGLRKAIAEQGKPAVTYKIQRGSMRHLLDLDHHLHPEKLHAQATHAVLRAVRSDYDIEQVDVAPHSMAGLTLASLNHKALQHIRQAHMMAPVGINEMSMLGLGKRVPHLIMEDVIPLLRNLPFAVDSDGLRDVARYLANPVRLLSDGLAISFCDTRERLQEIREVYDMPITTTWFAQDAIITAAEGHERARGYVDESMYFADRTAGHNAPINRYETVARHLVGLTQRYS